MLRQTLVEELDRLLVLILLEVRVPDSSQHPVEEEERRGDHVSFTQDGRLGSQQWSIFLISNVSPYMLVFFFFMHNQVFTGAATKDSFYND